MDASALKVADTAAIHIKDAAGEPLYSDGKPVTITIYGPGSRQYAAVEARQTARAVKRMQDNDGRISTATAEQKAIEQAEDLVAITVAFDGLTYGDRQGAELFEAVYADPSLGFIAKQVLKAVNDWGNFKRGSAAN